MNQLSQVVCWHNQRRMHACSKCNNRSCRQSASACRQNDMQTWKWTKPSTSFTRYIGLCIPRDAANKPQPITQLFEMTHRPATAFDSKKHCVYVCIHKVNDLAIRFSFMAYNFNSDPQAHTNMWVSACCAHRFHMYRMLSHVYSINTRSMIDELPSTVAIDFRFVIINFV